jgi:hypothetical protein
MTMHSFDSTIARKLFTLQVIVFTVRQQTQEKDFRHALDIATPGNRDFTQSPQLPFLELLERATDA